MFIIDCRSDNIMNSLLPMTLNLRILVDESVRIIYTRRVSLLINAQNIDSAYDTDIHPLQGIQIKSRDVTAITHLFGINKIAIGLRSGEIQVFSKYDGINQYISLFAHSSSILLLAEIKSTMLMSISKDGTIARWNLGLNRANVTYNCGICGNTFCEQDCNNLKTSTLHGLDRPTRLCNLCLPKVRKYIFDEYYSPLLPAAMFQIQGGIRSAILNLKDFELTVYYSSGLLKIFDIRCTIY
ncbi:hypothetical protein MXB_4672 [Myxobolus squamalis]|nr:hypothetical protein MXB_4672 [Myxobolus squamalis]